jgi:hypothetical protein
MVGLPKLKATSAITVNSAASRNLGLIIFFTIIRQRIVTPHGEVKREPTGLLKG